MKNANFSQAKNLANFSQLLNAVEKLSADYKPLNTELSLQNLQTSYQEALQAFSQVADARNTYQQAVNERRKSFAKLNRITSRLLDSARSYNACPLTINNLLQTARRIKGLPLSHKTEPELHRTAQLSYDLRLSNFNYYITQLESIEKYDSPNPELQLNTLKQYSQKMLEQTQAVVNNHRELKIKQINRNKTFFHHQTGLVALAQRVKTYLRSYYGAYSPSYLQISTLSFSRQLADV